MPGTEAEVLHQPCVAEAPPLGVQLLAGQLVCRDVLQRLVFDPAAAPAYRDQRVEYVVPDEVAVEHVSRAAQRTHQTLRRDPRQLARIDPRVAILPPFRLR